jgi:hypothetical protein
LAVLAVATVAAWAVVLTRPATGPDRATTVDPAAEILPTPLTTGLTTCSPTVEPSTGNVVCIGDSYTAGPAGWVDLVAGAQQWTATVHAIAGTGYSMTKPGGLPYPGQSARIEGEPQAVIVTGGRDDLDLFSRNPDRFKADVAAAFGTIAYYAPSATLIAVNPWRDGAGRGCTGGAGTRRGEALTSRTAHRN